MQVEAVMEVLLQNNKIRAATHNIMAYRIEQPEKGTFQQASLGNSGGCSCYAGPAIFAASWEAATLESKFILGRQPLWPVL